MVELKHVLSIYVKNELVSTVGLNNFNKDKITFGRAKENDIIIISPIVSVEHGLFEKKNGAYHIRDLESTNGLIVNGVIKKCTELQDGDSIRIDNAENPHGEGVQLLYSILSRDSEEKWADYPLKSDDVITIGRDKESDICLGHMLLK